MNGDALNGSDLRPVGDHAVLLELADNDAVQSLAAGARSRWGADLAEVVPGERTLLLSWRGSRPGLTGIQAELSQLADAPARAATGDRRIVVPVRYDGPDLEDVAAMTGLAVDQVVALHTGATHRVALIGFAPGFAYLRGGDPRLAVPRLDTPRERVAAGSVAIAAGYSAVYPTDSPGGWRILGHTELVMFDPHRDPPVLLEPGVRVTFEAV